MSFPDVKHVIALYSEDEVNIKLNNGWKLLSITQESDETSSTTKFVLGWSHKKSEKDFLHKNSQYSNLGF